MVELHATFGVNTGDHIVRKRRRPLWAQKYNLIWLTQTKDQGDRSPMEVNNNVKNMLARKYFQRKKYEPIHILCLLIMYKATYERTITFKRMNN